MEVIKMRMKKTGASVDVYGFVGDKAVCFDLGKYKNQNQGMFLTDLKALVPYDAYIKKETGIGNNSAKARVKLSLRYGFAPMVICIAYMKMPSTTKFKLC